MFNAVMTFDHVRLKQALESKILFHDWIALRGYDGNYGKLHLFLPNSEVSECNRAKRPDLKTKSEDMKFLWTKMMKLEPGSWFNFSLPFDFCESCRKKADKLGLL